MRQNQIVNVGRTPGSSMSRTYTFQNIKFSLQTIGGLPAYTQFTIPKDVNSIVYDVSGWANSLGNENNLTIAELIDEAFIPISDFIEEENLKNRFYDYYQNGLNTEKPELLKEPYLFVGITKQHIHLFDIETCLVSRYGEYIVFKKAKVWIGDVHDYVLEEAERISQLFPYLTLKSTPLGLPNDEPGQITVEPINEFDILNMSKYVDPTTGKTYLLTTDPYTEEKLAYTLYSNYVINDYIFEDLINSLPVNNNVTVDIIRKQYYIVAL